MEYSQQDMEKFFNYWKKIIDNQNDSADNYQIGTGKKPFTHSGPDHHYPGPKIFTPGQSILFLGCGNGDEVKWACEQGYKAEGVTLGTRNADRCREKGLKVYHVDMHFLPMADNTYDGVVSFQTLEHSACHMVLFYEIFRVLKPGGQTYHQSPDAEVWTMGGDLHHILCIDSFQAKGILLKTGFKDVTCSRIGDGRTIEIYGRKPE